MILRFSPTDLAATDLRQCSLVCRDWIEILRPLIWSKVVFQRDNQISQLCDLLVKSPHLVPLIQMIALSRPHRVSVEGFTSLAKLLQLVQESVKIIHLDYVPRSNSLEYEQVLSDELKKLDLEEAKIGSVSAYGWGPEGEECLMIWRNLRRLTLTRGFTILSTQESVMSKPAYQLTALDLRETYLSTSIIDWILGDSLHSLTSLKLISLCNTTLYHLSHLFDLVGPTLRVLVLALDVDSFYPDENPGLPSSFFEKCVELREISVEVDTALSKGLMRSIGKTMTKLREATFVFGQITLEQVLEFFEAIPEDMIEAVFDIW